MKHPFKRRLGVPPNQVERHISFSRSVRENELFKLSTPQLVKRFEQTVPFNVAVDLSGFVQGLKSREAKLRAISTKLKKMRERDASLELNAQKQTLEQEIKGIRERLITAMR